MAAGCTNECFTAAYAAFDEVRRLGELDKLQLTFQFPGNKTILVSAQLAMADGTAVETDPLLISIDSQRISPAVFTVLVQMLTKALSAARIWQATDAREDKGDECYDEPGKRCCECDECGADAYWGDDEDDEDGDDEEADEAEDDVTDLQQRFQQALDEEAARIAAHCTPEQPEPVLASLVCPACGFEVQGDWRYCPACATNLN